MMPSRSDRLFRPADWLEPPRHGFDVSMRMCALPHSVKSAAYAMDLRRVPLRATRGLDVTMVQLVGALCREMHGLGDHWPPHFQALVWETSAPTARPESPRPEKQAPGRSDGFGSVPRT